MKKKLPTRNSILGIFSRKELSMIRIGSMNTLQVLRKSGSLTVLDGGAAGEIVLPPGTAGDHTGKPAGRFSLPCIRKTG
jgi:hypothetical protein